MLLEGEGGGHGTVNAAETEGVVNGSMAAKPVLGVTAPPVRLTPFGAALVALAVAVPGGLIVAVVGWAL
jgi:hypothetical protein